MNGISWGGSWSTKESKLSKELMLKILIIFEISIFKESSMQKTYYLAQRHFFGVIWKHTATTSIMNFHPRKIKSHSF